MEGNSKGKAVSRDKSNRNPKRRDTIEYGWTKVKISGTNNKDHRYDKNRNNWQGEEANGKSWRPDTETRRENRRTRRTRIMQEEWMSRQQRRQGCRVNRQAEVQYNEQMVTQGRQVKLPRLLLSPFFVVFFASFVV